MNALAAWSTFATALFTLGLLLTAVLTACSAFSTLRAAREANEQAKRDSILQTRPYVYAEILPSLAGAASYDLVVRNQGRSAARDLRMAFEPQVNAPDDVADAILRAFDTPRDLPPGSSLRMYWHIAAAEGETLMNAKGTEPVEDGGSGMPKHGVIQLRYEGDDPSQDLYMEKYPFDVENAGLWPLPEDGPEVRGPRDTRSDKMSPKERRFYKALQALSRNVGALRW